MLRLYDYGVVEDNIVCFGLLYLTFFLAKRESVPDLLLLIIENQYVYSESSIQYNVSKRSIVD